MGTLTTEKQSERKIEEEKEVKKLNAYLAGKHSGEKWTWMRSCGLDKDLNFQNASHETQGKYWDHLRPSDYTLRTISEHGLSGSWGENAIWNIIEPLQESNILIAYLSCTTSFGSIAEIGYASARGIPSFIFFDICSDVFGKEGEDFETEDDYIRYIRFSEERKPFVDTYWLVSLFPQVDIHCLQECSPRQVVLEYLRGISTQYESATEKQSAYLRSLGCYEEPLTKLEASELIQALVDTKKKGKTEFPDKWV